MAKTKRIIVPLGQRLEGVDEDQPLVVGSSVFILTSNTYVRDHEEANFDDVIVGVYITREAAEDYRHNATPPVADGKIVEWAVQL